MSQLETIAAKKGQNLQVKPEIITNKAEGKKTASKKKTAVKKVILEEANVKITKPKNEKKLVSAKKVNAKTITETKQAPVTPKKEKPKVSVKNVQQKTALAKKITLQLKFTTQYGQQLLITGNHELFGNGNISKALAMQYFNDEFWYVNIDLTDIELKDEVITYNYALKSLDGSIQYDCGTDKQINLAKISVSELLIIDNWNYTGYIENAFYTVPFQNVLLKENEVTVAKSAPKKYTHTFQIKTPLLAKGQTLCIVGSSPKLNDWDTKNPILMSRSNNDEQYKAYLDLSKESFPIAYKYGVYDTINNEFVRFEDGNNRFIYDAIKSNKQTIVNDAFANLPSSTWRGAGVAIPVFSLKTKNSFGVGEFNDIKGLVDWSHQVGLKLIQILPINDTTATNTWQDSYPYAAISAFALNPIYINLSSATDTVNQYLLKRLDEKQATLNAKDVVDYEEVLKTKISFLKKIFPLQNKKTFASEEYKTFFGNNKHWLVPYAVFCYLRDEYKTANYNKWLTYRHYSEEDIAELTSDKSAAYNDISFHYFIQYHLHTQL